MKTVLTLLASLTLLSTVASAHDHCDTPRRVVGYSRCGDPIIATYEYVGRSRCGEPVYQWVTHYPRESEYRHEEYRHEEYRRHEEPRFSAHLPLPLPGLSLFFGHHSHDR